jgi:hypothetical protein
VQKSLKLVSLSAITTGLQAVATILSAVRVITASVKSLAATSHNNDSSEQNHKGFSLGMHKWIFIAGAVVGLITITYLENIAINFRPKQSNVNEKPKQESFETVQVNS